MRLRFVTTTLLLFGLLLLLAWPWAVGSRPRLSMQEIRAEGYTEAQQAQVLERRNQVYFVRFSTYVLLLFLSFAGAAVGASLMMRRVRGEFRETTRTNLTELIEGTLHDHHKKREGESQEREE